MYRAKAKIVLVISLALVFGQWQGAFAAEDQTMDTVSDIEVREQVSDLTDGMEYADDELIVSYDDSMTDRKIEKDVEKMDGEVEEILEEPSGDKAARVRLSGGEGVEEALAKYLTDDKVQDVQPNYIYKSTDFKIQLSGNDPRTGSQSFLSQLNVEEAWTKTEEVKGKNRTKVFVVDTGVTATHEDLQRSYGGKKYTRFVAGKAENNRYSEEGKHGTMVCGIIAADYNNGKGGAGVASGHNNDLVDLNVVGASFNGNEFKTMDVVKAVEKAVSGGARVLNLSLAKEGHDRIVENSIRKAYEKGVVVVAASGNNGADSYHCPSGMKEVISVNWAEQMNGKWVRNSSSNHGRYSDISAPGSGVLTTVPGGYGTGSGTSFAAPMVAGICAMILDVDPDFTPSQVYNIICSSTGQLFNRQLGYGVIDAAKCIDAAIKASGKVTPEELQIKTGGSLKVAAGELDSIVAIVRPSTCTADISFKSSNASVATVDSKGRVEGISPGVCNVTCKVGSLSRTIKVTVTKAVPASGISIAKKSKPSKNEMAVGQFAVVDADIIPSNATNKEIYYRSSNDKVAAVDEHGIVVAKARGKTTITAYTFSSPSEGIKKGREASTISDSMTIRVKDPVNRVEMTRKSPWVKMGNTFTFKAKARNKGNTAVAHSKIYWEVNDQSTATIDSKGRLTPVKPGKVFVYALYRPALAHTDGKDHTVIACTKVTIAKKKYSGKKDYRFRKKGKLKKKVVLAWKKNPIASGYEIQAAAKKNGKYKKIKTIKKGKIIKTTIKTKKTRYYRIRAYYYEKGKKKYFGFSNIVKGVVRK